MTTSFADIGLKPEFQNRMLYIYQVVVVMMNYKTIFLLFFASLLCISLTSADKTTVDSAKIALNADNVCPVRLAKHHGQPMITPSIEKKDVSLLLLLGFGGFSIIIAGLYSALRKYVYHDENNLDTVFDAGGRISLSLTAVTVTSQILWPADFLQLTSLISKSGLGGCLWVAIGIVIDILLFPALSLFLKTRAPGAKTFPQIAYARFGKGAHIMFCFVALFTNLIVCTSMILTGKTAIEVLCKDTNTEFVCLLLAVLFGSYCLIGGLGATFYISYFNTALTFISISVFILSTTYYPAEDIKNITSVESLYNAASCIEGPDGNYKNSYLTFRTESGVIYGIVMLFMATSVSFCDQANWQSRIAAKPTQGVVGFILAAYLRFIIPSAMCFTVAMSYFSMSFENDSHLLSEADIENGYITPFVMNSLLGKTGGYLLLTMLMMSIMSTGSGEVMSISSIIVYDIYKTYINPFRKNTSPSCCILCGKEKIKDKNTEIHDMCHCPSSINCRNCTEDIKMKSSKVAAQFGVHYQCPDHGKYRHYEDGLLRYKSWCMVWSVVLIVPYGLLIVETGMNVNWATLSTTVMTTPFMFPLFVTLAWSKATSKGVIASSLSGLVCAIAANLIVGSTYEGGLSDFYINTAKDYSLLAAMLSGFAVSGFVCIIISLCTHTINGKTGAEREWAKTINIDNPINPFRLIYAEELKTRTIITAKTMNHIFRKAKIIACIGGGFSLIVFLVIIPAITLNMSVLTLDQFSAFVNVLQICCFVGAILVVVIPPVEEGIQIRKTIKANKQKARHT